MRRSGRLGYAPCSHLLQAETPFAQYDLRLTGEPYQTYTFQATTNFLTWTNLYTNATPSGVIESVNSEAPDCPCRFYRAWETP